jgi:hypothetical protein
MTEKNYWCFRVDTNKLDFFLNELYEGRLRQGWGWSTLQDLRDFQIDEGAGRNRPMFNKVKRGDIILIPQLPSWGEVALAEVPEDWNIGYRFEIEKTLGDYGHIFPVTYLKSFKRANRNVTGNLRSTLKNPSRFWSVNHYSDDIDKLLNLPKADLSENQDYNNRLETSVGNVFNKVFDHTLFENLLFQKVTEQFTREEWEFALVYGLKRIFPFYHIERVGGKEEKNHGTDILIKLPSIIPNYGYAIAIQVKDYDGFVGKEVISQINKADKYWDSENLKLIEKIVIITKAKKEENIQLLEHDRSVKFIFTNDLKQILAQIGKSYILDNMKVNS